jgi:hypothetical protein
MSLLKYNEAAKDVEKKTRAFLDAHLAGTSPGEATAKRSSGPTKRFRPLPSTLCCHRRGKQALESIH